MKSIIQYFFLLIFTVILTGCVSTPVSEEYTRISSISMNELNSNIEHAPLREIADLISSAEPLNANQVSVEINASSTKAILIDGQKYLAKSYRRGAKHFSSLILNSYIIPVEDSPDYLFFPSISMFDSSNSLLGTVRPDHDYRIREGQLVANYKIDSDAVYIIVHTEQKYLLVGSIDGKNGGIHPDSNFGNHEVSIAIAGVLGGAIGGAIAGAMYSDSSYSGAPPENYFFGPGGVIDIKLN